ncbi:sporulation protein YpjB [Bacillus coahuilensis]|uniref:sporulation protein YpjB n=1 Tax=Bacillus coahuilensis TaxID=408580 RepID=UPI000185103A|nr:sporulation protein YpjB [Bacillus coahuilensis]
MKKVIPIILILMIGIYLTPLVSAKESTLSELDLMASRALLLTKQGNYSDALQLLDHFSEEFTSVSIGEYSLTMDELRIVSVSHDEAILALTSSSLPSSERIKKVTTFRLVVDALLSEYDPLWTKMQDQIMENYNSVKEAAIAGNTSHYNLMMNQFISSYSMIQPSITLDVAIEDVQRLDAKIEYINHYRTDILESEVAMYQFQALESDLDYLFQHIEEDEADPSLWWVILTTGGIIVSTLSYVGFRKYKADLNEKRPSKRHNS